MSYEANVWQPRTLISVSTESRRVVQIFTASASQTLFTLTDFAYTPGEFALDVYKSGLQLQPGVDFVETSSTTFVLATGAALNAKVVAVGYVGLLSENNSLTSDLDMNSHKIVELADGTVSTDAVNLRQLLAATTYSPKAPNGYVSVKDYGALGDGIQDDYQAFVDARAAARALGCALYAPGTSAYYRLSQTFLLDSRGDRLVGDGIYQSPIYGDHNGVVLKVTGDYWSLEDFSVSGKSTSSHGIQIGTGVANNLSASNGFAKNVYSGWVGGHAWYLAGAISSRFVNCGCDTNNGFRPTGVIDLGSEQWQWYITGMATAGCNYDCQFLNCYANGGGQLGGVRIGDSTGNVIALKWQNLLAQGNNNVHVYLQNCYQTYIDGLYCEGEVPLYPDRYGVTLDNCNQVHIDRVYLASDVRIINGSSSCSLTNGLTAGVTIDATSGVGTVVRNIDYRALSSGPTGGNLTDFSNVAHLENCKMTLDTHTITGTTLDSMNQVLFSSNMLHWYTSPSTRPCGFYGSGLTMSAEGTIKKTGTYSLKCVAGAANQYASVFIPVPEQLRGKRVAISSHVYNVTSVVASILVYVNGGTVFSQGSGVPEDAADSWYRVQTSFLVPTNTTALEVRWMTGSAGTFYVDDVLITTDGSIEFPETATLDTVATPELNPDNSFWQCPILYAGAGTNITNFLRPMAGKLFTIIFTDTRTVEHTATIKLNGSANFVGTAGDSISLRYSPSDNIFYEVGRMVQ